MALKATCANAQSPDEISPCFFYEVARGAARRKRL